MDHISWFNLASFLCLIQSRTYISRANLSSSFLCFTKLFWSTQKNESNCFHSMNIRIIGTAILSHQHQPLWETPNSKTQKWTRQISPWYIGPRLNQTHFSLFMTKIHTTVVKRNISRFNYNYSLFVDL
jgi:hypothetical protein